MGIRKILTVKEPALHKVCRPVENFDKKLHSLLDDMRDTLIDSEGVGLAAPQVGIMRRVVVIDIGDGLVELVNPVIVQADGEQTDREGCLSLPGRQGIVTRPDHVIVHAQDRKGREIEVEGEGFFARALCHELDHLDGILYIDKMERELTREEIADIAAQQDAEDDEE